MNLWLLGILLVYFFEVFWWKPRQQVFRGALVGVALWQWLWWATSVAGYSARQPEYWVDLLGFVSQVQIQIQNVVRYGARKQRYCGESARICLNIWQKHLYVDPLQHFCLPSNRVLHTTYKPYPHQYPNLIDTRTMILRSSSSRASVTSVENKNKSKIDKH